MQAYFTAQATFTASSPSLLGTAAEKGKVGVARMSFFLSLFLSFVWPEAAAAAGAVLLLALAAAVGNSTAPFIPIRWHSPPNAAFAFAETRRVLLFLPRLQNLSLSLRRDVFIEKLQR